MIKTIDSFREGYRFLSNFSLVNIEYDGIIYPSVEHFFQAMKSDNPEIRKEVSLFKTPPEAKKYGYKINLNLLKKNGVDWDKYKLKVMLYGLRKKFQDPILRQKLLDTNDIFLIEGNYWHDNEWGNCTCEKCKTQIGKNYLGKLLMYVRTEIQLSLRKETP